MVEAKTKMRRVKKAAHSPIPAGPVQSGGTCCGHSGCSGGTCQVRFVGPTSSMRDHHALHAARGVTNVWTAAIVAGFAIVLTGAIAYTAVEAESSANRDSSNAAIMDQLTKINARIGALEDAASKNTADAAVPTTKK